MFIYGIAACRRVERNMATISIWHYETVRPVDPGKWRWWGIGRGYWQGRVLTATAHFPLTTTYENSVTITGQAIDSHQYLLGNKESFWLKLENTGSHTWSTLHISVCVIKD
jgi:hypothetical protein